MKKFRRVLALALLLALSLFTLAIAQDANQSEILIDSSRNAALKFKSQESSDVSGTFNVGGDIVKGLIASKLDLKFKPETAKELKDAQGALYFNLTDVMEVVGNFDMTVPPEGAKDLKKLGGDLESVLSENKAYAKGNFNLEVVPNSQPPAVNADFNFKGDSKLFDGTLNFDVDAAQMGPVPLKQFQFGISEKEDSTTFDLMAAVDAKSQYAQQLKMIGANPDQIKQGLTQQLARAGIQVENVTVGEYKEEGDTASAKLSLTVKGWRNLISNNVPMMAGGQMDGQKLSASVGKMLKAKFDNLTLDFKVDGTKIKGEVKGKVQNMREFLLGYYELMGMVTEAQLKNQGDSDDASKRFMLAYQSVAMEEARKAMQAMIDGDVGIDGKGQFKMGPGGQENKNTAMSGDFEVNFSNYGAYLAKANAAGIPAGKNNALKMTLKMDDNAKLNATAYAYSDGKFINYYKTLLLSTAKRAGAPQDALAAAEKVEFKSGAGSFTLNKDGVTGSSYLESSDMSPLVNAAMSAVGEDKFSGQLTGFNVEGKAENNKMNIEGTITFAKFMEGKSADQIKSTMGVEKVTEGAKADQVALVAVNKPEVSMPGSLSPVADSGKQLLGSSPMASIPGLGGSGGSNLLYILGGLAAVGVVGAGLMAARKKS